MIVDDTDWEQVARAMDDYLAAEPRARRILMVEGNDRGFPQWWEGMQVLEWNPQGLGVPGPLRQMPRSVRRRLRTTPFLSFRANVAR